ncbi:MAG: anthranilate synthase component I family protein [Persicimonas sp.]
MQLSHLDSDRSNVRPVDVARRLSRDGATGLLFFDSAHADSAHWSILTCHPSRVLTEHREGGFVELPSGERVEEPTRWIARAHTVESPALEDGRELPFVGGLAGVLAFEFAWHLDDVDAPIPPARTPKVWVGDYPSALVYSHSDGRWWLTGRPVGEAARRLEAALREATRSPVVDERRGCGFGATVAPATYRERVGRAIDAIYAGELFEINYTERFSARWDADAFSLYEALRATESGAYGGFVDAGSFQLASVSPEQFLEVDNRRVVSRPIKGTRPRSGCAEEDARFAEELLASEKDRAENVMIVDLMRNDLTQVCRLGSVEATEICALESFSGVHHLVSTVEGELADGFSPLDALLAAFPAGSITGAPKLRAIELIAELEETPRGPYTGSLFYASRHGRLDSNVLIRTAVLVDGEVRYGSGGAVVADSDPRAEFEEARLKAAPLRKVTGDG